tara:strand:+ start:814 stop:963 length:150 start_codon:yes stop_codon:yes gene_type:complete
VTTQPPPVDQTLDREPVSQKLRKIAQLISTYAYGKAWTPKRNLAIMTNE